MSICRYCCSPIMNHGLWNYLLTNGHTSALCKTKKVIPEQSILNQDTVYLCIDLVSSPTNRQHERPVVLNDLLMSTKSTLLLWRVWCWFFILDVDDVPKTDSFDFVLEHSADLTSMKKPSTLLDQGEKKREEINYRKKLCEMSPLIFYCITVLLGNSNSLGEIVNICV